MQLRHSPLRIACDQHWLDARLAHAPDVRALVVLPTCTTFNDAAGLPALSAALETAGFATLQLDLLSEHEHLRDPDAVFNIPQLAHRLAAAHSWIRHQPPLAGLACALLSSGTASAAAIRAAWKQPDSFVALISYGGRPDLAGATPLAQLRVPLCMVVGAEDPHQAMIRQAYERVGAPRTWHTLEHNAGQLDSASAVAHLSALADAFITPHLAASATVATSTSL